MDSGIGGEVDIALGPVLVLRNDMLQRNGQALRVEGGAQPLVFPLVSTPCRDKPGEQQPSPALPCDPREQPLGFGAPP